MNCSQCIITINARYVRVQYYKNSCMQNILTQKYFVFPYCTRRLEPEIDRSASTSTASRVGIVVRRLVNYHRKPRVGLVWVTVTGRARHRTRPSRRESLIGFSRFVGCRFIALIGVGFIGYLGVRMHPFAFVIFLATGVDETFDSAAFDRASSDPAGSLCRSNRPRCRLVYPEGFENTEVRKYFRTKVLPYFSTSGNR